LFLESWYFLTAIVPQLSLVVITDGYTEIPQHCTIWILTLRMNDEVRVAQPVMPSTNHFKERLSLVSYTVTMLTCNDVNELAYSQGFSNSRTSLPVKVFVVRAARDVDEDDDNKLPIGHDANQVSCVIYSKRSKSVMTGCIWKVVTKGDHESMISQWGIVDLWSWKER
jgi:hypothetical protein